MKKVSSRDFQLNAAKYLKELPIILTSRNIPVATVIPYTDIVPGKVDFVPSDVFKDADEAMQNVHEAFNKKEICPFCNESVPAEFVQKHYNEKHSDL